LRANPTAGLRESAFLRLRLQLEDRWHIEEVFASIADE
jgi:hypothetical protein